MTVSRQSLKSSMLPVAFIGGVVLYKWMGYVTFLSPYFIFAMLFITYCKLEIKDFSFGKFHFFLLGVQMALSALTYFVLLPAGHTVAEGVFICVFIPTATAAPVITSMLGGSISRVASYSLLCNVFVSLAGPVVLAAVGDHAEYSFLTSLGLIASKVFPLLIAPIICAFIISRCSPRVHKVMADNQSLSFYLWAISLFIIVGSCVSFVINHWNPDETNVMAMLAVGALAVCLLQFKLGRLVGRKFNDAVSGGQSLGQKNTVLAVWLALAYMNPIASVGPAAYIAWQNIINSWQLIKAKKEDGHKTCVPSSIGSSSERPT